MVGLAILGGGYVENSCLLKMDSRKFGGRIIIDAPCTVISDYSRFMFMKVDFVLLGEVNGYSKFKGVFSRNRGYVEGV